MQEVLYRFATEDTYAYQQTPDTNYGASEDLLVLGSTSYYARSYLKFDVSGINAADIDSVELFMYYYSNDIPAREQRHHVKRITAAWDENTLTYNSSPAFNGSGALATGSYGQLVNILGHATGVLHWRKVTLTSLILEWINGTYANYGVVIDHCYNTSFDGGIWAYIIYRSSEATTTTLKPFLKITLKAKSRARLIADTQEAGYLTLNGSSHYAIADAALGVLSGSFVLDIPFRATDATAHKGLWCKVNPSSGGAAGGVGYFIGTHLTGTTKLHYNLIEGTGIEYVGITTLQDNTDYILRIQSDGSTVYVKTSSDGGQNWITENTINNSDLITALAANNSYPVNIGRDRWAAAWVDYWNGRIYPISLIKGSSNPADPPTNLYKMYSHGPNPILFDRKGLYPFTGYGELFAIKVTEPVYDESGEMVYGPYDLSDCVAYYDSNIQYSINVPTNTTMKFLYALTETTDPPVTWLDIGFVTTSGNIEIPIEAELDLVGKYLWLKVEMATTDTTITPDLYSLSIWVEGPQPQNQIQLNLSYAGRMKYPIDDVYLDFTGLIIGQDLSFVYPFSESFIPVNISPFFNPNDAEYAEVSATGAATLYLIDRHLARSDDEHVEVADATVTAVRYHVDDIPP